MPSTSNRQASIDSRRIALEREISIRVPRFDQFVTEYSTNISTTGMFIVSGNPQAPGTTFTFEFSVADDWKLIRGKAQVVWTRYRDEGGERPAGMGVRFVELDAQSRRLIRWIVEKHIREGGKPFELEELRTVIDEALEDVVETDDVAAAAAETQDLPPSEQKRREARPQAKARRPAPVKRRTKQRTVLPLVATAAGIVLALGFLFWLTEALPEWGKEDGVEVAAANDASATDAPGTTVPAPNAGDSSTANADGSADRGAEGSPGSGPAGEPADEAMDTSDDVTDAADNASADAVTSANGAPGSAPATSAPAPAGTPQPAAGRPGAPPIGSAYSAVRALVTDWAAAWSAQDPDTYLSFYSKNFSPDGSSRSAWEATRRDRLTSPRFIRVAVSQFDINRVNDYEVAATFFQSYRSDRFTDSVQKTLDFVWEDGTWKIQGETSR